MNLISCVLHVVANMLKEEEKEKEEGRNGNNTKAKLRLLLFTNISLNYFRVSVEVDTILRIIHSFPSNIMVSNIKILTTAVHSIIGPVLWSEKVRLVILCTIQFRF